MNKYDTKIWQKKKKSAQIVIMTCIKEQNAFHVIAQQVNNI